MPSIRSPNAETRLPLQAGTAMLDALQRAGEAAASLSLTALVVSVYGLTLGGSSDDSSESSKDAAGIAGCLFAVVLPIWLLFDSGRAFARLFRQLALSRAEMPSDLLVGPAGLRISGGKLDGYRVGWEQVARVELEELYDKRLVEAEGDKPVPDEGPANFFRLVLVLESGERVELATCEDDAEHAAFKSLSLVLTSYRNRIRTGISGGETRPPLRCQNCGATVKASSGPTATCEFCRAQVPVPEALRPLVKTAEEREKLLHRSQQQVTSLMRPHDAAEVMRMSRLVLASFIAIVPAVGLTAIVLHAAWRLNGVWIAALLVCVPYVPLTLLSKLHVMMIERFAGRDLVLNFSASAPVGQGEGVRCRVCGVPLSPSPDAVLAQCPYCCAVSIATIDLSGELADLTVQSKALDEELKPREVERGDIRIRARIWTALFAVLLAFVGWHHRRHPGVPRAQGSVQVEQLTNDLNDKARLRISPAGDRLAFTNHGIQEVLHFDPKAAQPLGRVEIFDPDLSLMTWTDDGGAFAFVTDLTVPHQLTPAERELSKEDQEKLPSDDHYQVLRLTKLDRELHPKAAHFDVVSWAPDGQHFVVPVDDGSWHLDLGDRTGTAPPRRLVDMGDGRTAAWSPDGTTIAFVRGGKPTETWILAARFDGEHLGEPWRVSPSCCSASEPAFSPDGQMIAYAASCDGGADGIHVVGRDGTGDVALTVGEREVHDPLWLKDTIYFTDSDWIGDDLYRLELPSSLAGHGHRPAVVAPLPLAKAPAATPQPRLASKPAAPLPRWYHLEDGATCRDGYYTDGRTCYVIGSTQHYPLEQGAACASGYHSSDHTCLRDAQ